MWSREFFQSGISTAFVMSALVLVVLALLVGPLIVFGAPGLVVYPFCWYVCVYRRRSYSVACTIAVVVISFFMMWLSVVVLLSLWGLYLWFTSGQSTHAAAFVLPLFLAVYSFIPYMIVATPMAFFHRRHMLLHFSENPKL